MLATNRLTWYVIGILGSLMLAGCATDTLRTGAVQKHYRRAKVEKAVARQEEPAKIDTGSIEKAANPVTSRDDPRWRWCHRSGQEARGRPRLRRRLRARLAGRDAPGPIEVAVGGSARIAFRGPQTGGAVSRKAAARIITAALTTDRTTAKSTANA